jgi:predicted AAA+ superfamily ATPase
MRYLIRTLEGQVLAATRTFPALVLTGPRRAGKTFPLQPMFPRASYYLFDDPDIVARFRADPQGFLDEVKTPAILDEIEEAKPTTVVSEERDFP